MHLVRFPSDSKVAELSGDYILWNNTTSILAEKRQNFFLLPSVWAVFQHCAIDLFVEMETFCSCAVHRWRVTVMSAQALTLELKPALIS